MNDMNPRSSDEDGRRLTAASEARERLNSPHIRNVINDNSRSYSDRAKVLVDIAWPATETRALVSQEDVTSIALRHLQGVPFDWVRQMTEAIAAEFARSEAERLAQQPEVAAPQPDPLSGADEIPPPLTADELAELKRDARPGLGPREHGHNHEPLAQTDPCEDITTSEGTGHENEAEAPTASGEPQVAHHVEGTDATAPGDAAPSSSSPPSSSDGDRNNRGGTSTEDEEGVEDLEAAVARLAKVSALDYERVRKAEAKRLGIGRVSVLDKLVEAARGTQKPGQGRPLEVRLPEPWPNPVDGGKLLDEIRAAFDRHVVLPRCAATALALWVLHTYVFGCFGITPRLAIISPVRRCGRRRCWTS